MRLARIETITHADSAPDGSVQAVVGADTFALPLAGVVDVAAERARLGKESDKLAKEIGGLERKLANEGFLAKAPAAVVEEQRERLADALALRDKLSAALDRLSALS